MIIHLRRWWRTTPGNTVTACGDYHKINSSIVTQDTEQVTCPKCLEIMANRVEKALEPPTELDRLADNMRLCRKLGESDADLQQRLRIMAKL